MERPPFIDQLQVGWDQDKFLCVGLDAEFDKLPTHLKKLGRYAGTREFLFSIIDATEKVALAYKPNIAFFEDDPAAEEALRHAVAYIHANANQPVIVDAKRGDILNTNLGYARSLWSRYSFDASTVHSYLGADTYPPFLDYKDGAKPFPGKGIIAMAKTSNPQSPSVQDLIVNFPESVDTKAMTDDERQGLNQRLYGLNFRGIDYDQAHLYVVMAYRHEMLRQQNPNIGIVVGATHAESFIPVRRVFDGPILIPGIGTQGGDLAATLRYAPDSQSQGMIINVGSSIIFAENGPDFASVAGQKARDLHNQITQLRKAA